MNEHGEHHRCERCEARGRAEAEAKVAALNEEITATAKERDRSELRVAALTAALARVEKIREIEKRAFVMAKCAAPDCGSELNPVAPQYYDDQGRAICPACWWKAATNG